MAVYRWGNIFNVGPANTTIGAGTAFSAGPAITALSNGGFAVAWTVGDAAARSAGFQIFSVVGDAVTGRIAAPIAAGATYMPDITTFGSTIALSWMRDFNFAGIDEDVRFQQYDLAGVPLSAAIIVAGSGTSESQAAIAAFSSGSVIAYTFGNGDIKLQRLNADGANVGLVVDVATGANLQINPAIAVLTGGNIAVGWYDGDYRLSLFSSAGAPIGGAINLQVASATISGGFYKPSIAALANGNLAIAFQDSTPRPTDGDSHVSYQIFTAAGAKLGAERVANISAIGVQTRGDIVALADGGFMITWSTTGTGLFYDVYGARFDVDGNRVGGEFAVATGPLDQADPATALLADGRVAVTWLDQADNTVKFQILDPRDGQILGGGGANALYGHPVFSNEIIGAGGNDTLFGGTAIDQLYGEDGNDTAYGNNGDDQIFGGLGNDLLITGFGDDRAYGEDGVDTLYGEGGNDFLAGGFGNDSLYGQAGNDSLFGEGNNDRLEGGDGDDTLVGQEGSDTLFGEAGGDFVAGGNGIDQLSGGSGADTFYFATQSEGTDTIIDFNRAEGDRIGLQGSGFSAPAGFGLTAGVGFLYGAGVVPVAATATVYYDTNSRALWYDQDGTGGSGANVIAFLPNQPIIQASDIFFA